MLKAYVPLIVVIGIFSIFFLVFFLIIYKGLKSSKKDSKIEYYKSFGAICISIGFLFILVNLIQIYNQPSNNSTVSKADGFTIEKYNVKLDVSEKNIVDVNEEITVNFYESGHHGIYRFIPSWLSYTGKNGETISRKSLISNLSAIDDEYTIDTINGKERIKIGNPNYVLSKGYKTYNIKYQYDMGNDPYNGFDEFIFHAFGDYWGTRIKNASIELTMPKAFEEKNIKFFADKYRQSDITNEVSYYVQGNTLYAKVSNNFSLMKSLTIDVELPENYFNVSSNPYGNFCLFICITIIVFSIITFIKWLRHGKDFKYVETVEFYPPNSLDAAEIGYIYKNDTGKKLVVALLVSLASKGYIKIEESEDKETRTIINIGPKNNKNKLSENEAIVYAQLFKNGNENIISEDKEFYQAFVDVSKNVKDNYEIQIEDIQSYKNYKSASILFLISNILWTLAYTMIEDLNPKYNMLYYISFGAIIITLIFTLLMKRKNNSGAQLTAKIYGFKNYIETAEKNQIEQFVLQNPNYFYDILPYAYVLGVSKKWIDKFENIPEPKTDMGNFDYSNIDSFNSLADSFSSSSSSGCGGGCSSCGGGCSSCGGGGSW